MKILERLKFKFSHLKLFAPSLIASLVLLPFLSALYISEVYKDSAIAAANEILEGYATDIFYKIRGPVAPSKEVALVTIDEKTLSELGRFPFPRYVYKEFIERLNDYDVKVAAFDILFADEMDSALKKVVQTHIKNFPSEGLGFPEIRKHMEGFAKNILSLDDSKILAESVANSRTKIVLAVSFNNMSREEGHIELADDKAPISPLARKQLVKGFKISPFCKFEDHKNKYHQIKAADPTVPIAELFDNKNPPELGHIKFLKDTKGGIVRYFPLFVRYHREAVASLPLRALSEYLGEETIFIGCNRFQPELGPNELVLSKTEKSSGGATQIKNYKIPIGADGRVWINHVGDSKSISTFEFIDVLKGRVKKADLAGKIVFIGAAADSLGDTVANPFTPVLPGVEIHATIASNALTESTLSYSEDYTTVTLILLVISTILISTLLSSKRMRIGFIGALAYIFAYFSYAYSSAFLEYNELLPLAMPAIHFVMLSFAIVLYQYFVVESEKSFIRNAFAHFVSRSVVNEIVEQERPLALGGEKKEITVLFTDIRGFTAISESLDAQELTELLNTVLTDLTNIVIENDGTLDKYVGDAMMCFWGAPIEDERHAHKACLSALQIQRKVHAEQKNWQERFRKEVFIRIGVNTGLVSVGNMGSTQVFDYTVIGDPVNIGSRLESLNRHFGSRILVGERTYSLTQEFFTYRHIDRVRVKGKVEAIDVYELINDRPPEELERQRIQDYEQALQLLIEGKFSEARTLFANYQEAHPHDESAKEMLSRLDKIDSNPELQKSWKGSWSYED